jgi:hypothetical protein
MLQMGLGGFYKRGSQKISTPTAQGDVFFLDFPFYRTRKLNGGSKDAPPAEQHLIAHPLEAHDVPAKTA